MLRVSGISSPFFIQKLSSWALWALVRLHCSVRSSSTGSVMCSDGLMDGSAEGEKDTDQFREWAALVGWKLAARCGQAAGGSGRTLPPHTVPEGRTDGGVAVWEELFWGALKRHG